MPFVWPEEETTKRLTINSITERLPDMVVCLKNIVRQLAQGFSAGLRLVVRR